MASLLRPLAVGRMCKGPVMISSSPTAAEITIVDQSRVQIYRGTTPTTITLDASAGYFDGQEYTVTFSKDGYDPTTVKVDSTLNGPRSRAALQPLCPASRGARRARHKV